MQLSVKGFEFLKCYETVHDGDLHQVGLQPKPDASGIWTEGFGHAMTRNGKFLTVKEYPTIESVLPFSSISTEEEAERLLKEDIASREVQVNSWVKVPLKQNQFDALLLHTYNCGKSETLYRLVNSGADEKALGKWWTGHYTTSAGEVLKGLVLRRMDEWEIWKESDYLRNYSLERS